MSSPQETAAREEFIKLHRRWENHSHLDMSNDAETWEKKGKHVFIYTDAGKPVFTRYGDEIELAPFMGTLTALGSVVKDTSDTVDDIVCDNGKTIIFHTLGPIEIVFVSNTGESPEQLKIQAEMVGRKLCSIVPYTTIISLFQKKTSYDFRKLIQNDYDQIKYLIHSMNISSSILYNAVKIIPCPCRNEINDTIIPLINNCNDQLDDTGDFVVFTLIAKGLDLLYINQRVGCSLTPKDIHILLSFVQALPSKDDKWVPLGLHDFNQSGQLFTYCKFFNEDTVLTLLATKNESLPFVNNCAENIMNSLTSMEFFKQLETYDYIQKEISSLYLHYVYVKIEGENAQLHEPNFKEPYEKLYKDQKRLHRIFKSLYEEMKNQNLKEYYSKVDVDCVYASLRSDYFFCGTFNIADRRDETISRSNKIIQHIKSNYDELFISSTKKGKYKCGLW